MRHHLIVIIPGDTGKHLGAQAAKLAEKEAEKEKKREVKRQAIAAKKEAAAKKKELLEVEAQCRDAEIRLRTALGLPASAALPACVERSAAVATELSQLRLVTSQCGAALGVTEVDGIMPAVRALVAKVMRQP